MSGLQEQFSLPEHQLHTIQIDLARLLTLPEKEIKDMDVWTTRISLCALGMARIAQTTDYSEVARAVSADVKQYVFLQTVLQKLGIPEPDRTEKSSYAEFLPRSDADHTMLCYALSCLGAASLERLMPFLYKSFETLPANRRTILSEKWGMLEENFAERLRIPRPQVRTDPRKPVYTVLYRHAEPLSEAALEQQILLGQDIHLDEWPQKTQLATRAWFKQHGYEVDHLIPLSSERYAPIAKELQSAVTFEEADAALKLVARRNHARLSTAGHIFSLSRLLRESGSRYFAKTRSLAHHIETIQRIFTHPLPNVSAVALTIISDRTAHYYYIASTQREAATTRLQQLSSIYF